MAEQHEFVVLGAGISGLSTAFWLQQEGRDVRVLESSDTPGGSVKTIFKDGFLIEQGPNTALETSPAIKELVSGIGLLDQMIYARNEAQKRYIFKNGELLPLPSGPSAFISSRLFSMRAKWRLLGEPFIGPSRDGYYQSIAEFVRRRLGQEFLDYAVDPFVSGVCAGDPDMLSVKSAFPKLYRLEELYGGLIKGAIKGARERRKNPEVAKQSARMFSFKNGLASLPNALAEKLANLVTYNASVEGVEKDNGGYKIIFDKMGGESYVRAKNVISTVPAYVAFNIFGSLDKDLSIHLKNVYYPPVMTLLLGYRKKDAPLLDGFGFLIPSREQKKFLGAIWNSTIFDGRVPDDCVSFTLFIGGARHAGIFDAGADKAIEDAKQEFMQIMNISARPVVQHSCLWKKAIPQYNIGYIEHENYFDEFEKAWPGIFLSGNYRGGISFGDCIRNSKLLAERVLNQ